MSDGGKGSARRPTDHASWSENFDRIFGGKGTPRPESLSWPPVPTPELAIAIQVQPGGESANDGEKT